LLFDPEELFNSQNKALVVDIFNADGRILGKVFSQM
jgi:hypothetical protein